MFISNYQYLTIFILSLILVGVLTPVMRKVAIKNNIFDLPNSIHKSHTLPTPYLGGIAIMLGVVLASLLAVLFSTDVSGNLNLLLSVIIPALLLGLIGLWDDLKSLPAYPRLLAQSAVGMCVSIILITTGTLGNPTGSLALDVCALFLGVLLATLAIRLDPITQSRVISLSIPLLLLALPILDTTAVVISRLRNGVSIFQGGQDHLSHRLVKVGLTRKSAVIVLWLLCILFVLIANLVSMLTFTLEVIFLLLGAVIWFALLLWFLKIPVDKNI